MSTTFDVFPSTDSIPLFSEVIGLCSSEYNAFLQEIEIQRQVQIHCILLDRDAQKTEVLPDAPFQWSEELYAWFTVEDSPGGIDGYFFKNDDLTLEFWKDSIFPEGRKTLGSSFDERFLKPGHHWSFRRSAGQPGTGCIPKKWVMEVPEVGRGLQRSCVSTRPTDRLSKKPASAASPELNAQATAVPALSAADSRSFGPHFPRLPNPKAASLT